MAMIRLACLGAVLALAVLSACVPVSLHPLSDPDRADLDPRLAGTLWTQDGHERLYIHLLPRDQRLADAITVSIRRTAAEARGEWMAYTVYTTPLGSGDYANLKFVHGRQGRDGEHHLLGLELCAGEPRDPARRTPLEGLDPGADPQAVAEGLLEGPRKTPQTGGE